MADEKKNITPLDNENSAMPQMPITRKPGGLYRNVKMSVKTANILVAIGAVALLLTMFILIQNNGFTVKFDTDGGSYVESCKVMHGETVPVPEQPVKEGYEFKGWYLDRACTQSWDIEKDTVTQSFTLYAGWQEKSQTVDKSD